MLYLYCILHYLGGVGLFTDTFRLWRVQSISILPLAHTSIDLLSPPTHYPLPPRLPEQGGIGPDTTLAWPGWKQPDIPVEVDTDRLETSRPEARVLKKLSLAGIAD